MEENIYYYLAYGSNMNQTQMSARCPEAIPVGTAMVKGYQLGFRGSNSGNYLTIDRKKDHEVPVVVWKVSREDINNLNRYEGYPCFYKIKVFKNVEVTTILGDVYKLDCFAYIMVGNRPYGMPNYSYFKCCEDGYKRFGVNSLYLNEALEYTKQKGIERGDLNKEDFKE